MSDASDKDSLSTCGCCEAGTSDPTLHNTQALPALSYRVGTHSSFLRRMIAHLSTHQVPDAPEESRPLSDLTTRDANDPAIAMLDAWAIVADVLTFYQERIANEGFLRTATERRSVLELARTIGYELSPGVSAESYLIFTVDDVPPATGAVTLQLTASADLGEPFELILVAIEGTNLGPVFQTGASDCADPPDEAELTVAAEIFNAALAGDGSVQLALMMRNLPLAKYCINP